MHADVCHDLHVRAWTDARYGQMHAMTTRGVRSTSCGQQPQPRPPHPPLHAC